MQFDDRIFNEMQDISIDPMENEYVVNEILPKIQKQENTSQDLEIWFIPDNSLLYAGLMKWYGGRNKALKNIRSAVEDGDGIYFASDAQSNFISTDLLGSEFADKDAKHNFIKMLNTDHWQQNRPDDNRLVGFFKSISILLDITSR